VKVVRNIFDGTRSALQILQLTMQYTDSVTHDEVTCL